MGNELQKIVSESGLEKTKAQVLLDNFSNYFEIASDWEKKAKTIKVTSADQEADMKMARIGRLELRQKRIDVEKTRKELKEQSLREGKAIDGIANVLKAVIVPIETYLKEQECFIEIQEEKRREAERILIEKKIEEERIENERLDSIARERYEQAIEYKQFWSDDKYDFRGMNQSDFRKLLQTFESKRKNHEYEQEKVRKENERLKKEAEEREKKAKAEAEERAKKEAAEQKAREEKERRDKEASEAEIRKIKEAAEQEKQEARERAAKEEAERKALEDKLKNQIECPHCHKKFILTEKITS